MDDKLSTRPKGWNRPPTGWPRQCWNIFDSKPKRRYQTLADAVAVRDAKQSTYYCDHCSFFHNGHTTTKSRKKVIDRFEYIELELGIRAASHLLSNDAPSAIAKRLATVQRRTGVW